MIQTKKHKNIKKNLNHIIFQSQRVNKKFIRKITVLKTILLNLEIQDINIYINYLSNKLHNLKEKLNNKIETNTLNKILESRQRTNYFVRNKQKQIDIKKFKKLTRLYHANTYCQDNHTNANNYDINNNTSTNNNSINTNDNDINSITSTNNIDQRRWFRNLSGTDIPNEVIEVTLPGPKFNLTTKLNNKLVIDCIKNIEQTLSDPKLGRYQNDRIRAKLINNFNLQFNKKPRITLQK